MKKYESSSHTQEQITVIEGLKQLRRTNRWLLFPLNNEQITSTEVQEYLSRELDENPSADAQLEKDIATAIYLSVKRSKWKPRQSAKLLARQAIEELRAARLTVLYHDNRISAKQYKEECENNYVMNTIAVAKRIKKRYGRIAIKTAITVGLAIAGLPEAATVAGATMLINAIIPKKHKEKIKKQAKQVVQAAVTNIRHGITRLKEMGRQVAECTANVLTQIAHKGQKLAEPILEATRNFISTTVHKTTEGLKKLFNWH